MDPKSYDELHGSNNWDGLLDPLDLSLRKTILAYGDLSSAAEHAFNDDQGSKNCGYCNYGKTSFFKGAMLPWADSHYQVASFLYATARIDSNLSILFHSMSREGGDCESNWMGYVAVSNDQVSRSTGIREITVAWRGTVRTYEWIDDILGAMPVSAEPLLPPGDGSTTNTSSTDIPQVMEGWLTIYTSEDSESEFVKTSARTQLLAKVRELLEKYKDEKVSITCTGHSLGACLAVLSAFDLATNVATPDILVTAFVFASPQVGNEAFKAKIDALANLKVLRVKNKNDLIPFWPSKLIKAIDVGNVVTVPSGLLDYVDVGIEIEVDSQKSPYLKEEKGLDALIHVLSFHNLQVYLHTLAGWNGEEGEFDWDLLKRSLGLVNMRGDLLVADLQMPGTWWVEKNKGMELTENGDWVLWSPDPDDDLPVY